MQIEYVKNTIRCVYAAEGEPRPINIRVLDSQERETYYAIIEGELATKLFNISKNTGLAKEIAEQKVVYFYPDNTVFRSKSRKELRTNVKALVEIDINKPVAVITRKAVLRNKVSKEKFIGPEINW